MWRYAFALVAACSFEHGTKPALGVSDAARLDALPKRDPTTCPAPPSATCVLFTCAGSTHCYYECGRTATSKATWVGAVGSCTSSQRGCIVTITDQLEQDCIAAATAPEFPDAVWLGLHQNTGATEPDGDYLWQCGDSALPPAWLAGEPDNAGGVENCVAMNDGGSWLDLNCGGTARFVCELP